MTQLMDLLRRPVVVAPMAGGPSTPGLVIAAARAGALGFLAGGYKAPGAMAAEIAAVRAATAEPFGVNLFVPGTPYPDADALASYLDSLGQAGDATWDDDGFEAKVAALLADPPPLVSFTFGCPAAEVIKALREAGSAVAAGPRTGQPVRPGPRRRPGGLSGDQQRHATAARSGRRPRRHGADVAVCRAGLPRGHRAAGRGDHRAAVR